MERHLSICELELVRGHIPQLHWYPQFKSCPFFCFSTQVTIEHSIPSSVRRFVIGSKGVTLKGIESKSGARIQIPRSAESTTTEVVETAAGEDDEEKEDEMINITITGDSEGVKLAKAEIENIVNERVSCNTYFFIITII